MNRLSGKAILKYLNDQSKVPTVVLNSTPIKRYYHTAEMLHQQAVVYLGEHDWERAYVQLKKFALLYLHVIAAHNSYNLKTYQPEKFKYKRLCSKALDTVGKLKTKILEKYGDVAKDTASQDSKTTKTAPTDSTRTGIDSTLEQKSKLKDDKNTRIPTRATQLSTSTKQKMTDRFALLKIPSRKKLAEQQEAQAQARARAQARTQAQDDSSSSYSTSPQLPTSNPSKPSSPTDALFTTRKIILPGDFTKRFMGFASKNTRKGIETCGIICGSLKKNEFHVTACILPPQTGSANTTTTMGEEKLIKLQEDHNLLTLGWIHTHPTQACFLSSIDLHTQFSYQIMMPEAIAIVMAPTDPRCKEGVFSLTEKGLKLIGSCNQTGFHQHEDPNGIYRQALHVEVSRKAKTKFFDLRKSTK
ncbi:hypothetical protein AAMO2058_000530000 [Amorphochlora amoebiformis]